MCPPTLALSAGSGDTPAMSSHVLLVEDDEALGRQVRNQLREEGYEVTWLQDGSATRHVEFHRFGLVILDLMLPGTYGLDVLRRLREECDVPVLILSARNATHDKVRALELGADDFVTKPFWPEELLARVKTRMRRPSLQRGSRLEVGALAIDDETREVAVDERPLELTRVEFELLLALAKRPGAAIERSWLVEHVLDPEREGTERTLDVHVSRLRKKLGDRAKCVATVWGVGYRLDPAGLE